ncbi:MAG: hypothetical protein HC822_13320 [Oscillochloris sp.]|nr:hypothetical protein [Oscillochloris sp.]
MAVNTQPLSSIAEARARRLALPRYLQLDGSRYLLGLVVILCLMSLIVLVQTGAVATRGYALAQLQTQQTEILRERSQLMVRLARAQSLERVRLRAAEIGLRPYTEDQVRYLMLPQPVEPEELP